jgi:hypothetical protein
MRKASFMRDPPGLPSPGRLSLKAYALLYKVLDNTN